MEDTTLQTIQKTGKKIQQSERELLNIRNKYIRSILMRRSMSVTLVEENNLRY